MDTTIEWFGATTYRLRTNGLTIFLDTWINRPSLLPKFIDIKDIEEADYIFISHAHFDHLPGADVIAKKTGAIVIANGEAIKMLSQAGVPDEQLVSVAGGERIPLFTRQTRDLAVEGKIERAPGFPDAPQRPAESLAAMSVHVWPSLHCMMPKIPHDEIPEVMDTQTEYHGLSTPYSCTLDITFGMKYGLLRMGELTPPDKMDAGMKSFVEYVNDKTNVYSYCDGGQLAFNFIVSEHKILLWSAHLGGYEGVFRNMTPKPDVAILGIAGRANLNGRPFNGSAAQFVCEQVKWLGEPRTVIWTLQDESVLKPYRIDTRAATRMVEEETASRILELEHAKSTAIFE